MRLLRNFHLFICLGFLFWLAGCATTKGPGTLETQEPERTGIYHKVKKGETLWRIAQAYSIPINDIIAANHIPDVAQVEESQLLFIPGAFAVKEIPAVIDASPDFIWPVDGKVLSYFRDRDGYHYNKGLNIEAQDTSIKAAREGEVVFSDFLTGYGQTVVVDHKDGFHTVYSQMDSLLVKSGDRIKQGQAIAQIGSRPQGSFLHFEIRKNAIEDNPFYYLPQKKF